MMTNPPVHIKLQGFNSEECLSIHAESLSDASYQYGKLTKHLVAQKITEIFSHVSESEKHRQLSWALMSFKKLSEVNQSGLCVVDSVNWLDRYVQAFTGFCQGANISAAMGALLQLEIEPGCQTIVTKEQQTNILRFIHTEEDGAYVSTEAKSYPYRWVDVKFQDTRVSFFIYPGLCGWGPAFGFNHHTNLTQLGDDLFIKNEYYGGPLWANAVSFMTLDCGHIQRIERLFDKISSYPDTKYAGGYALNFLEPSDDKGIAQVEFAHKKHCWSRPNETPAGESLCHTNSIHSPELQQYSCSSIDKDEPATSSEIQTHLEMKAKRTRLEAYAQTLSWYGLDSEATLKKGLQLLAEPEADIQRRNNQGQMVYRYCCLPSVWTAAHTTGYCSTDGIDIVVGKHTPPPIPGREYSLTYRENYPHSLTKLWEIAEKNFSVVDDDDDGKRG